MTRSRPCALPTGSWRWRRASRSGERAEAFAFARTYARMTAIGRIAKLRFTMFDIDIQIDRPVATVFDCLKDIEACSRWYEAVRSVDRVSSGPTGQGSRFQFKR